MLVCLITSRTWRRKTTPFFGYKEGANTLTITVAGRQQSFASVDQFLLSAPAVDRWKFVALKSPLNLGPHTEIKSGSVLLKLDEVRYTRQPNADGSFDFTVFVPVKVSDDPQGFQRLFTRLLEDLLGERLAATLPHSVKVQPLQAAPTGDLREFIHVYQDTLAAKPQS